MRWLSLVFALVLAGCDTETPLPYEPGEGWDKVPNPVWQSPSGVASDPEVIREGNRYRMCYTCLDGATDRTAICGATSDDGLAWRPAPDSGSPRGVLVRGLPGTDEAAVEGCELVERDGTYLLYYSGYPEVGDPVPGFPAALYLATSSDGEAFERQGRILAPTPGGRDNDAVYSPTIRDRGGRLEMVYTGHCYTDCDEAAGVVLLGAESADGRTWTKRSDPVLTPDPSLAWTLNGVAEAALFEDGLGGLALLFTAGLGESESQRVGLARATSLDGPWTINPEAVLAPTPGRFDGAGLLAPSVLVEDGRARTWFFGFSESGGFAVGYAEASHPLPPRGE